MKKACLLMFVGALALSLPVGCKKDKAGKKSGKASGGDKGGDKGGNDGPSAEEMADRMLSEKLDPYIKMTNYLSNRVFKTRQRYFQWLKDPNKGPTCKERYIYGVYTLPTVQSYVKAVEKAQKKDPQLKLLQDGAAQYIDAIRKLEPLLKKANRYYEQKDYKDDKCKGAKAMHPQMMALWKQFMAANNIVKKQIEKINVDMHYRLLARYAKKYGKTSPIYYHKKFTLDARSLLHLFLDASRSKKPDHEKLAAAVTKIDALYTEMADKTSAGKQPSGYSWFRSSANKLVKAAKEMKRRMKSGKKFSKHEKRRLASTTAYLVKGSYPAVLKAFNDMIGSANRVRFRR